MAAEPRRTIRGTRNAITPGGGTAHVIARSRPGPARSISRAARPGALGALPDLTGWSQREAFTATGEYSSTSIAFMPLRFITVPVTLTFLPASDLSLL